MAWICKHKRVWRVAILVLLPAALMGPWAFDLINVPSKYPCSAPFIRLEGDYCGLPLSAVWIYRWIPSGLATMALGWVTGETVFTGLTPDFVFGLLYSLLLLLLVLPFFSTLVMIFGEDRRPWQVIQVAVWGSAAVSCLLLGVAGFARPHWALWGIWLFIGLVASALTLEVLLLMAERKPSQGGDLSIQEGTL